MGNIYGKGAKGKATKLHALSLDHAAGVNIVDLGTFYSALTLSLENIRGPEQTWKMRSAFAPHATDSSPTTPWNSAPSRSRKSVTTSLTNLFKKETLSTSSIGMKRLKD